MSQVQVYERAAPSFAATLAKRGHHVVYRTNSSNHCPGCGRSQWYIGRITAECGFCGTAVPLAEARADYRNNANSSSAKDVSPEQRRSPRTPARGRKLQLLIDGSPVSFALHDISEGGAKGEHAVGLVAGATVHVRSPDGSLAPAIVKWTEDGLVGLEFTGRI